MGHISIRDTGRGFNRPNPEVSHHFTHYRNPTYRSGRDYDGIVLADLIPVTSRSNDCNVIQTCYGVIIRSQRNPRRDLRQVCFLVHRNNRSTG